MEKNSEFLSNWIPLEQVKKFFNYGPTQMAALLKDKKLKVAKIGKRKFIWLPSIEDLLERNSN
jgi:hypothetical protein